MCAQKVVAPLGSNAYKPAACNSTNFSRGALCVCVHVNLDIDSYDMIAVLASAGWVRVGFKRTAWDLQADENIHAWVGVYMYFGSLCIYVCIYIYTVHMQVSLCACRARCTLNTNMQLHVWFRNWAKLIKRLDALANLCARVFVQI